MLALSRLSRSAGVSKRSIGSVVSLNDQNWDHVVTKGSSNQVVLVNFTAK